MPPPPSIAVKVRFRRRRCKRFLRARTGTRSCGGRGRRAIGQGGKSDPSIGIVAGRHRVIVGGTWPLLGLAENRTTQAIQRDSFVGHRAATVKGHRAFDVVLPGVGESGNVPSGVLRTIWTPEICIGGVVGVATSGCFRRSRRLSPLHCRPSRKPWSGKDSKAR